MRPKPPHPAPPHPAPTPYRRGWRAPWRKQWGTFGDGHTRLSCLARTIEGELREKYVVEAALDERDLRVAARLMALSEATIDSIGREPKATLRAATAAESKADRRRAKLKRRGDVPDLARRLAAAQANGKAAHGH